MHVHYILGSVKVHMWLIAVGSRHNKSWRFVFLELFLIKIESISLPSSFLYYGITITKLLQYTEKEWVQITLDDITIYYKEQEPFSFNDNVRDNFLFFVQTMCMLDYSSFPALNLHFISLITPNPNCSFCRKSHETILKSLCRIHATVIKGFGKLMQIAKP